MPAKKRVYKAVIERDEDGLLVASVPELPGCHTQARTKRELTKRLREAVEAYLLVAEPPRVKFVGIEDVEVEA